MQVEPKNNRIISIDCMRGLTVALMIFVNSPGSWDYVFPLFAHAQWNGCTLADLIFPFFLFIVGLSVFFSSVSKKEQKGIVPVLKLVKRSATLFFIGLLINGFPFYHLSNLRIPGVLQRISMVFLVCALLNRYTSRFFQCMLVAGLLLGYWLLMRFVKPPGASVVSLEPTGNLSAWVDACIFKNHVWAHTKPWDPEGLLGTLPAIATGLTGVLTAVLMHRIREKKEKLLMMPILGVTLLGFGLCWSLIFPINKNLWTSSYVLFTSGIAQLVLWVMYYLLDVKGYKKFTTPLMAFGSNAISAYILSELLEASWNNLFIEENYTVKDWIFNHCFISWLPPIAASHIMAGVFVGIIYLPIYWMYNKKILIKI